MKFDRHDKTKLAKNIGTMNSWFKGKHKSNFIGQYNCFAVFIYDNNFWRQN